MSELRANGERDGNIHELRKIEMENCVFPQVARTLSRKQREHNATYCECYVNIRVLSNIFTKYIRSVCVFVVQTTFHSRPLNGPGMHTGEKHKEQYNYWWHTLPTHGRAALISIFYFLLRKFDSLVPTSEASIMHAVWMVNRKTQNGNSSSINHTRSRSRSLAAFNAVNSKLASEMLPNKNSPWL